MKEAGVVERPNHYLIVVDVQNDFVTGSLGSVEAQGILEGVVEKARTYPGHVIFTLDTHEENYLATQEGQNLPVEHCMQGTEGWNLAPALAKVQEEREGSLYRKPTFGSLRLAQDLQAIHEKAPIEEIELVGLCTDICVVSNALLLKAHLPEVRICVDSACCAGVTPQKHEAALETMRSCQILVK